MTNIVLKLNFEFMYKERSEKGEAIQRDIQSKQTLNNKRREIQTWTKILQLVTVRVSISFLVKSYKLVSETHYLSYVNMSHAITF